MVGQGECAGFCATRLRKCRIAGRIGGSSIPAASTGQIVRPHNEPHGEAGDASPCGVSAQHIHVPTFPAGRCRVCFCASCALFYAAVRKPRRLLLEYRFGRIGVAPEATPKACCPAISPRSPTGNRRPNWTLNSLATSATAARPRFHPLVEHDANAAVWYFRQLDLRSNRGDSSVVGLCEAGKVAGARRGPATLVQPESQRLATATDQCHPV